MTDHDSANVDHQITAVARRLTDGQPPDHLHARVMAQLDERTRSSAAWRWLPMATGLVAVALVAVVIVRHSPAPVEDLAPQESSAVGGTRAVTEAREAEPFSLSEHRTASIIGTRPTRDGRLSEVQAEWQARALPPLSQPQALSFEGIQPDPLAIRPLETPPLTMMPIGADENR